MNNALTDGQTMRVFPCRTGRSWTWWRYVARENLEVVPLYFTQERPVVKRQGTWIMVDDDRMEFEEGEQPQMRRVRFRSLGDYPLSGRSRARQPTCTTSSATSR